MDAQNYAKLNPLILCCRAESGFAPASLLLPDCFVEPEMVVVSDSAVNEGYIGSLSKSFKICTNADLKNLLLKLATWDIMIVTPLSLNSLAKFALGIRDSLPSELFWQFSRLARPILLDDSCLPNEKSDINPHLYKTYKNHWQNIIGGTIDGFNQENLQQKAASVIRARQAINRKTFSQSRVFITKDDVIEASKGLEPLSVPYGSVITDLAREEAEKLGVKIVNEGVV